MKKQKNNIDNDILGAILGAAILGELTKENETPELEVSAEVACAQKARKLYDAFVEEGFTDEQATTFVAAIMS